MKAQMKAFFLPLRSPKILLRILFLLGFLTAGSIWAQSPGDISSGICITEGAFICGEQSLTIIAAVPGDNPTPRTPPPLARHNAVNPAIKKGTSKKYPAGNISPSFKITPSGETSHFSSSENSSSPAVLTASSSLKLQQKFIKTVFSQLPGAGRDRKKVIDTAFYLFQITNIIINHFVRPPPVLPSEDTKVFNT
ncbi:hypothetical protein [Chryseobacterium taeanense]|uniref:hypothetical protein n=1 Tax=Chryseobacterium taeanense TaxID=311334 RepID=UPI0035B36F62